MFKRALMLLATSLACSPALSADLATKATPAPAPILNVSPFYIGILGGAGFSSAESDITFLGTAQGPLKAYPTGMLAGGEFGARWNTSPLVFGLNITALYDFSRGNVVGTSVSSGGLALVAPAQNAVSMQNGVLLMEGGEFGINLSTLMGYVPTAAQPSHWIVPITVPTQIAGNLNIMAIGGLAQRWQTLCGATVDASGNMDNACASRILDGPYIGGQISGMFSTNWEAKFKVAHIFWNSSFTPASAFSTVFSNTVSAKDETLAMIGMGYHF